MRKFPRMLTAIGALGAAALTLAGCAGAGTPVADDGTFRVVTTTTQLDDFTKQVVGDTGAEVTSLLQPGTSVHGYEPTPADLEALRKADVVIFNGVGLEPWLDATLTSAEFTGTRIDASVGFDPDSMHDDHGHAAPEATDGAATEDAHEGHDHGAEESHEGHDHEGHDHEGHDHGTEEAPAASEDPAETDAHDDHAHDDHGHSHDGHDHGGINPHIWTSPDVAQLMVNNVAAGLGEADAANAATYTANASSYNDKLQALDDWTAENIKTIPAEKRLLVTNHDALTYFNDEYHVTFVGSIMPSWDDNAEPSAAQIDELIANIKSSGVTAIFTEQQLAPETANAIASETGAKVYSGEEGLYTDALGAAGSSGATYISSQVHNVTQLMDSWGATVTPLPSELAGA
ncbi:zinc ABC transporter substrate-binding protein [Gulosibacter macacae]|uniref:Zinc ABC transporter substrate-binding protein n=1 Tax=Gulosibacter macacae TaxID=2488791 RepID=A0A3P3VW24_9MICO|nr:metal ABC transporter substrate-binding protein [Gulosibacter macacae]RRJ86557.1 zinc ABC transporter substrate-binding protein [Gulosibacter macacae]